MTLGAEPRATVRVVYGNHLRPVDPARVGGAAAVVLETGAEDWSADPAATLAKYRAADRQYAALLPRLERERVPVYFLEAATAFPVRDVAVMAAEAAAGCALLRAATNYHRCHATRDRARGRLFAEEAPRRSRRLVLAGAGAAAVAAWLQLPLASTVASGVMPELGLPAGPATALRRAAVAVHPECEPTHLFRNAVLAYKLSALSAGGDVAVVLGPTHSLIERDIRTPAADLLARIRSYRPAVRVTAPETVSAVCRMDFRAGRWLATQRSHLPGLAGL